ncbi:MAG: TylF/MycF/NovP-related O-methyltransferase [Candidatus Acidiferrales bacterium]
MDDPRLLYLDVTKKALTFLLYGQEMYTPVAKPRNPFKKLVFRSLQRRGIVPMQQIMIDREKRMNGLDWPPQAYTMIGLHRLDNLQFCATDVLSNGIPGDIIEAGTWRGGAAIFLRAILKAYGITDRTVWVADSFEGLPTPDQEKFPADAGSYDHTNIYLAVPLERVKLNFSRFGLLDDQVRFLKGWFKDTLPGLTDKKLSVIRLDADMYESTIEALRSLYANLSIGGYVVIDDYALACCREAVNDFRDANQITEEIQEIDSTGVFWRRER